MQRYVIAWKRMKTEYNKWLTIILIISHLQNENVTGCF